MRLPMGLLDIFRRPAPDRKESQASQLLVVNPGQPVWSPRNYESFAKEAYGKNVVAYQSINRIADASLRSSSASTGAKPNSPIIRL